jgi:hypothetical protein
MRARALVPVSLAGLALSMLSPASPALASDGSVGGHVRIDAWADTAVEPTALCWVADPVIGVATTEPPEASADVSDDAPVTVTNSAHGDQFHLTASKAHLSADATATARMTSEPTASGADFRSLDYSVTTSAAIRFTDPSYDGCAGVESEADGYYTFWFTVREAGMLHLDVHSGTSLYQIELHSFTGQSYYGQGLYENADGAPVDTRRTGYLFLPAGSYAGTVETGTGTKTWDRGNVDQVVTDDVASLHADFAPSTCDRTIANRCAAPSTGGYSRALLPKVALVYEAPTDPRQFGVG